MSVDLVIHGASLVDEGAVTADAWIAVDSGVVAARGVGGSWRELGPRDAVDAVGGRLTPGFIDLHGHGGGGASYEEGAEAIVVARALHRAHGTTRAVISLATDAVPVLRERLRMLAEATASDEGVLGVHLEGPFLAPDRRGAHAPELLRTPDPAVVDELLDAAGTTLRQVTLAPELPGASEALRSFADAGVVVAVGHTEADFDVAAAAFDAGATVLTHAFNAMRGLGHRQPGPVGAALADTRVTLELIADGVHVHPVVIAALFAAAPGRVALVTDAIAAAGAGDGRYRLGGLEVDVAEGAASVAGTHTLAGSTATQDAALRISVAAGVPLPAAVHALTAAPARALGLGDRYGSLTPGRVADAVLLDEGLRVRRVWVAGAAVRLT